MRARPMRQTGTSAPVARAASITPVSSSATALARASRRSAAAASDDPPPRPAATGRPLDKMKRAYLGAGVRSREMTCRAQHEIVFDAARDGRARTLDGKRERFAFGEAKRVASARQSDQTFERVPAVGAAAGHMQSQIDFRGRAFGEGLEQDGCRGQSSLEELIGTPSTSA